MRLVSLTLFLLLLSLLGGCTPALLPKPLPPGLAVVPLADGLVADAPVAVTPDGAALAAVRSDGLYLLQPTERRLSPSRPTALAFSADGSRLAAAFAASGGSELVLFAGADGAELGRAPVAGTVSALFPAAAGFIAVSTEVQPFRFGTHLTQSLLRWDGAAPPQATPLYQVTLKPATAKALDGVLARLARPVLSPYGDELLFRRLFDPPAFPPYFRLILYHLDGGEAEVAKLPLVTGSAAFAGRDDEVLIGDGGVTRRVDPWQQRELTRYASPGGSLAVSPGGGWLWIDRTLWRDREPLLHFDAAARPVAFLSGGRLLVQHGQQLQMLTGLDEEASPLDEDRRQRLLTLRKWRASGLITPDDFSQQMQEQR